MKSLKPPSSIVLTVIFVVFSLFILFTAEQAAAQTGVWQSCETGTTYCNNPWDYSMGYQFTPTKNGQITHLCGRFTGSKSVRLYDSAYSILASAQVTSSNTWSCTSISYSPVNVSADHVYYVVVELAGSVGCYENGIPEFPQTCQGVTINTSVYQYPSGTFNASHTSYPYMMYGIADVVFIETTVSSYTLFVSKTGTGSGIVSSSPSGINCGTTCSASFSSGTSVTLTSVATSGTFTGWSGDCSGATCTVSMTANRSVTANFDTAVQTGGVWQSCETGTLTCGIGWDYSMGYQFTPTKNGQITKLCGQFSGTKSVRLYNSAYSILASAQVTSSNSWSCTSLPSAVNVSASQVYYVLAEVAGSGACYRGGTTFPTTCQGITINASVYDQPSGTFDSSHWSETSNIYGIADIVFVETATSSYTLSVSKTGTGSGTVTSSPSGINCGSTCSSSFTSGTSVTLTTTASGGSTFTGWSGEGCSGTGTCSVSMTANRSATANFSTITYSCQEHNVSGWAWSENIGWISFSCKNQGAAGDYGLDIADSTGLLSGYAWSENIGWITFNRADTGAPPAAPDYGTYLAKIDLSSKEISGWARTCSVFQTGCSGALDPNRGGWEGWIKLRDTSYRTWVNSSISPAEFRDWGWSDMNVGWITFNCIDINCGASNYKVITSFSYNQPPQASFSCVPSSCTIYTGETLTLNNNSSDPDNNLARSEWDILNWGSAPDLTCCASGCDSSTILCNYTVQSLILGKGTYSSRLSVWDVSNETNSLTKAFSIKQDIVVDFKCSLDNSNWQSCANFHAQFGAKVYFQDQSTPSEGTGVSISSRVWAFTNGTPATVTGNILNPLTRFYSIGTKQVSLTVTDTTSRSASKSYNLQIDISFPKWEEIAPF